MQALMTERECPWMAGDCCHGMPRGERLFHQQPPRLPVRAKYNNIHFHPPLDSGIFVMAVVGGRHHEGGEAARTGQLTRQL
jgi:hypothetical protein